MIAPLRRRHRWMTLILGVVVFLLFILALTRRAPEPVVPELPAPLAPEASP